MIIDKAVKLLLTAFFLYPALTFSQQITIGTELGGGIISSNSPGVGSFYSSLFFEGGLTDEDYIGYRITFFYAGDFSILLPEDRSKYYPFIKGGSLKIIHSSELTYRLYFEQGLGILALNDHVFSDRNEWGSGLSISLLAGKDMRASDYSGFRLGIGTEYGLTFINFSSSYFTVFVQLGYTF